MEMYFLIAGLLVAIVGSVFAFRLYGPSRIRSEDSHAAGLPSGPPDDPRGIREPGSAPIYTVVTDDGVAYEGRSLSDARRVRRIALLSGAYVALSRDGVQLSEHNRVRTEARDG